MKTLILAGGFGTRMREETENRPKPMIQIGGLPVIWHIMKHLSGFGLTDFVVLAGYKSEIIKDYFANYWPLRGDFSIHLGTSRVTRIEPPLDEESWNVTILDSGLDADTGDRVLDAIERLQISERFLVVYGDSLVDVDVSGLIAAHENAGRMATVTAVRARSRFGQLSIDNGQVVEFREKPLLEELISIGYFIFEPEAIPSLSKGGALEANGIRRLTENRQLTSFEHSGFWKAMDTFREYEDMVQLWDSNAAPWKTW